MDGVVSSRCVHSARVSGDGARSGVPMLILEYPHQPCSKLAESSSMPDMYNTSTIDLARLGQTTQVRRSTVAQVRARIDLLRAQSQSKITSKNFDFESRLKLVVQEEEARRKEKKEGKKRKREEARLKASTGQDEDDEGVKRTKGAFGNAKKEQEEEDRKREEERQFEAMMGFSGGFGGGVKKR